MAALTGLQPKNTYKDLLQVSNSNSGIDGTLRSVSDGEGTSSVLQLSSAAVNINSATGLQFQGTTALASGILKHEVGGLEFDLSAITTDDFLVGTGSGVVGIESGATARTSLGAAAIGANTFTATQRVSSADAGAAGGPDLELYRNSASPAASDNIGQVLFIGEDDGAAEVVYARIFASILDPANLSEDGKLTIQAMIAGSATDILSVGAGVWAVAATGGDKGAGTGNFSALYQDGVAVQTDLDVVSTADAEAGIATDERIWTAERVAEAIAALATVTAASQATMETGTSTTDFTTPGRQHFHAGHGKAWVLYDAVAGTTSASYNVTSVTDDGLGDTTVTWATDFSSANYAYGLGAEEVSSGVVDRCFIANGTQLAGSIHIITYNGAPTLTDMPGVSIMAMGDFA